MIDVELIRSAMDRLGSIEVTPDGVRVQTHCVYPTNMLVSVTVRGGEDHATISDDGGAIREAASVGLDVSSVKSSFSAIVRGRGLIVSDNAIVSPSVPVGDIAAAIVFVANASKDVSEWCFNKFRYKRKRKFKDVVAEFVNSEFGISAQHDYPIAGRTSKTHLFEHAIVGKQLTLLIDTVTPDAASINSRVVANLDVRNLGKRNIEQYIMYDDTEKWDSPNLQLLRMAAPIVPYNAREKIVQTWRERFLN